MGSESTVVSISLVLWNKSLVWGFIRWFWKHVEPGRKGRQFSSQRPNVCTGAEGQRDTYFIASLEEELFRDN